MTSDKKNQHYIPKFYLRNFSFQNNRKQIGVYDINNCIYVQRGKLKTQGSVNFYYGKDGELENKLAEIETHLANAINSIIETSKLPKKGSEYYHSLLFFTSITAMRNPVLLDMIKGMNNSMKNKLNKLDPNFKNYHDIDKLGDETLIQLLLSMSSEVSEIIWDLEIKLLINETETAFISSDYPIVKYNQFLEKKNIASKTGYGVIGLQIIFPINDKYSIILFDSSIYKVGNKRDKFLLIKNQKDIDSLNILQFVNCLTTIYFNEKTSENYIKNIHQKSKKFKRANQGKSELSYFVEEGEKPSEVLKQKENLIIVNATDCETKLEIQGLKIHSKGKAMKNVNSNELRLHPKKLKYAK